jgi:hypothetical protein
MSFVEDCFASSSIRFYFRLSQSYSLLMKDEGLEPWKFGSGLTFGRNVHYFSYFSNISLYLYSFSCCSFYFFSELFESIQNYLIVKLIKLFIQLLFCGFYLDWRLKAFRRLHFCFHWSLSDETLDKYWFVKRQS